MRDGERAPKELAGVHIGAGEEDLSRGEAILRGTLALAALYGAASVAPFVSRALAKSGGGDAAILDFLLGFEYVESALYSEAKTRVKADGELSSLIELIAKDEDEHVRVLSEAIEKLGGKPAAKPKLDFPYSDTSGFLELAQTLEDTGISAYNGAMPRIESKEALRTIASIVQVEARHAAAIRLQNGQEPSPEGFDFPQGDARDLKVIEPFIQ